MRLGVLTGGGDCPGLNALVRAVVKAGVAIGDEFIGIGSGFRGLIEPEQTAPIGLEEVRGILPRGGTILGTSNRADPFRYPVRRGNAWVEEDVSDRVLARAEQLHLDGVIAAGGDGTLQIADQLFAKGLKVVGCPKTIDNDLAGADPSFGYDTARAICTEAVDRLHTTAESHDRVMALEVMGRNAGFLALESGIAGGADAILIPELPWRLEPVLEKIRHRARRNRSFTIVVVSEGARMWGGEQVTQAKAGEVRGRGVARLGGAGKQLGDLLAERVDAEVRVTALGHLQRGGSPSAADRLLASRFGVAALDLAHAGGWGQMVGLRVGRVEAIPLRTGAATRQLGLDDERLHLARALSICLGDG